MIGIGRDGDHGLGRCLEQDVVDHGLVLVGDLGDWGGQREHDVEIRHRQELGLALGEPLLRGSALAFRAMPVTAGVEGDPGVAALVVLATFNMATERSRAAVLDGRHDLDLAEADMAGIGLSPRRSMAAENIRDLQRRAGHGRGALRRRRVFPAPLGLIARVRQQVEWALDGGDHAGGDAGVARRRVEFVMAQQS
jgi:hypothetical protein